jgi:hypothetical protein
VASDQRVEQHPRIVRVADAARPRGTELVLVGAHGADCLILRADASDGAGGAGRELDLGRDAVVE